MQDLTEKNESGESADLERATFGAGCFWGVEAAFRLVDGVAETTVGFMGGSVPDPTYQEVCDGATGHTEVVDVRFDRSVVTYERLVGEFFAIADPTGGGCAQAGHERQYRLVIFYHSESQRKVAERLVRKEHRVDIAIEPAGPFYQAEEYHQQFYEKCGRTHSTLW